MVPNSLNDYETTSQPSKLSANTPPPPDSTAASCKSANFNHEQKRNKSIDAADINIELELYPPPVLRPA